MSIRSGSSSLVTTTAARASHNASVLHLRPYRSWVRVGSQNSSARINLNTSVYGSVTTRGSRPYQEDTTSCSCLTIPPLDLRNSLKKGNRISKEAEKRWTWPSQDSSTDVERSSQLFWFGIFDGHGGSFTSRYLSAYLHQIYEFVTPDMVTDTVQFTRQHGGYFKRFNGGTLERWVVKEHLRPVRGGGGGGQPSSKSEEDSQQGPTRADSMTDESSKVDGKPKPAPKLSAAAAAKAASTTSLPPWDDNDLTKRIPPPPGMENETLTLSERATLAFLVADRHILNRYPQPQGEFPLSSMHDPTSFPLLPHGNKGKGIATRPSDRGSGTESGGGGGSTATVCTLHSLDSPPQIWYDSQLLQLNVNHVGDTRLLLVPKSDGQAIPLTTNHHPDTSSESDRLRKLGAGIITDSFGESRWMGALANTRAFGDGKFKSFGVTSEPEIISQVIKSELYSCLILFSDGINEVMSDQEVIDLIRESNHPQLAAKEVLKFAEELGVEDNATVIIVPLKGWGQIGGTDITKKQREYRKSKVDVFRDHRK